MSKPLFCESPENSSLAVIHDAVFQITDESGLRLDVAKERELDVSNLLCSEVSRCPSDIKNHIRRVWLQYDLGDSERLFAALLDLWIALNGAGKALFKRLLLGAKSGLQPFQFEQLVSLYKSNELRPGYLPEASGSCLVKGVTGRLELVQISEGEIAAKPVERDPLQEAHDCLEYSQVEQAQQILEKALLENPAREALHTELLTIYKSTHDLAALNELKEKLGDENNPFIEAWSVLKDQLTEEPS